MRHFILLILVFFITFPVSAYAEDNKITVINEDGSKTSIDIRPTPEASEHVVITPSRAVDADTAKPEKAPIKEIETKPAKKPAAPKQAAVKETPVKKSAAKKDAAPKKKKAEVKPQKKTAQKKPEKKSGKKPVPAKTAKTPEAPRPSATRSTQNMGPNMTSDDAIRIALDAAPPARSVHASPVNYKGLHAYEVVFATENGNRFIYVDRETGKIVK